MRRHDDAEALRGAPRPDGGRARSPESEPRAHSHPLDPPLDRRHLLGLQRSSGNAAVARLLGDEAAEEARSPVADVVGSGRGRPLDPATREDMESRLGHDFSEVRIHDYLEASDSAKSVQAHAYTVGTDVVFQSGRFDPTNKGGRRELAHELTHVIQQRSGPVDGTPQPGGIRVSDPSDPLEREAEAVAEDATNLPDAEVGVGPGAPRVQRQADEEEELQMTAQRQADEEEELQMSPDRAGTSGS